MLGTGAFNGTMFGTGAFQGTTFGTGAFKGTNFPKTGFAQQEEEIKVNFTIKDFLLQCPTDFILNLEISFLSDS